MSTATKTGSAPAPVVEEMTDVKASSMLRVLFSQYLQYKKDRPKSPSEAVAMRLIGLRPEDESVEDVVGPILEGFVADFTKWSNHVAALLDSIFEIGTTNPSASISVTNARTGRVIQINGKALHDALLRTEAEILGAKLA